MQLVTLPKEHTFFLDHQHQIILDHQCSIRQGFGGVSWAIYVSISFLQSETD